MASIRLSLTGSLIVLACASLGAGGEPQSPSDPPRVYHDGREQPLRYVGPGREQPDPTDVTEVKIGYFGPSDPGHTEAGDMWSAAQLAVEEANRQGGYHGKPFRLIARWSEDPWVGGARHATQMVFVDKVWVLVGGADGASTHLAEQIATKGLIPVISPVSTDRSANSAFVPWMFSCLPGDDVLASLLADRLVREKLGDAFVVVACDDHDSRVFLGQFNNAIRKRSLVARQQFVYPTAPGEPTAVLARVLASKPRAVVLLAGPAAGARLVKSLRQGGYAGPVLGGPWMGRHSFLEAAGPAAVDVVFPLLYVPGQDSKGFVTAFERRVRHPTDYAAAATYDAVRLAVAAVRKAGLNRARIVDSIRDLSPWQGVSGQIRWDALGGNDRPVSLGTIHQGRAVPLLVR